MSAWNELNTNGFSAAELEMLSNAQSRLARDFPGIESKDLKDLLNNSWYQGITENEIVDAVSKQLRQLR